jgi:hypothetical protein
MDHHQVDPQIGSFGWIIRLDHQVGTQVVSTKLDIQVGSQSWIIRFDHQVGTHVGSPNLGQIGSSGHVESCSPGWVI